MKGLKHVDHVRDINVHARFIVQDEKNVVCILNDNSHDMDITFRGVAKCNFDEGDVFDVQFGKELSLRKALEKRNKFMVIQGERYKKYVWKNLHETSDILMYRCSKTKGVKQDA